MYLKLYICIFKYIFKYIVKNIFCKHTDIYIYIVSSTYTYIYISFSTGSLYFELLLFIFKIECRESPTLFFVCFN